MINIVSNLKNIKQLLPPQVKLIAVSKFHPVSSILDAYNAGQLLFGESRMQELVEKQEHLPSNIEWHFIGNLQSNKVKAVVACANTIHSVDSWKLLTEINKYALAANKKINCLLEIRIAREDTKAGLSFDDCREFLSTNNWKDLNGIHIVGLMGMATNTDDGEQIRKEFRSLKSFFEEIKLNHFENEVYFKEISMGMSDDFTIAIEEGATMVRIGSSIFGHREY